MAGGQSASDQSRPDRLRPEKERRHRSVRSRPTQLPAADRPVARHYPQPFRNRRHPGRCRNGLSPVTGHPRGTGRIPAGGKRTVGHPVRLPVCRPQPICRLCRRMEPSGRPRHNDKRDLAAPGGPDPHARQHPLLRFGRMEHPCGIPRRRHGRFTAPGLPRSGAARTGVRLRILRTSGRYEPADGVPGHRTQPAALVRFLEIGCGDRPVRQRRSALERTRTADRPVAIPDAGQRGGQPTAARERTGQ